MITFCNYSDVGADGKRIVVWERLPSIRDREPAMRTDAGVFDRRQAADLIERLQRFVCAGVPQRSSGENQAMLAELIRFCLRLLRADRPAQRPDLMRQFAVIQIFCRLPWWLGPADVLGRLAEQLYAAELLFERRLREAAEKWRSP